MGGGPSEATQEQQQVTLQASQQELGFQSQLMTLFQQQFSDQKGVLDFLQSTIKPVITAAESGQGFSPQALSAMRTTATDTTASQFQNAQAALNQELKTSGSANVPSGVTVGADAALAAQAAETQAGGQNQITLANQQQAQSNLWNGINALNGVAAQVNPLGYGSEASGAGGTVAGLSGAQSGLQNAITNANNSSFWGSLSRGLGGALGSGLGNSLLFGNPQLSNAIPFANPL
jgi:hypothetical protein